MLHRITIALAILVFSTLACSFTPDTTPVPPTAVAPPATVAPASTASSSVVQPTQAFCQRGTTTLTTGPTESLAWDATNLRGYMNDSLAALIQTGSAYCKTVFPREVTLLFDSIAANPVRVNGRVVLAGNGRIETGTTFEWIYTGSSPSNGHAYIIQR